MVISPRFPLLACDALAAEGQADVVVGSLQESYGVAKKSGVREVTRRVDAVASAVKKHARGLDT